MNQLLAVVPPTPFVNNANRMEKMNRSLFEMVTHVPLFLLGNAKNVILLGDDETAREILRHSSVEICVRVGATESFRHPRVKSFVSDEVAWVENSARDGTKIMNAEVFDVICVQSPTLARDCTPAFFAGLKKLLAARGILVFSAGSPFHSAEEQKTLAAILKEHFKRLHFYNFCSPDVDGGLSSIAFASDGVHPLDDLNASRVAASDLKMEYYNLGIHEGAFLLPQFQKENLEAYLNPL